MPAPQDQEPSEKPRRWWWRLLQGALLALIVYFIYDQVDRHWEEIRAYDWRPDLPLLVLSIVIGLAALLAMSVVWRSIVAGFGHRLSIPSAFRIFYLSNLGRYIPGKIWQLFGILYLAKQKGIPPERATASFVLVQLFAIPASFLVFVIAAQFAPGLMVDRLAILGSTTAYLVTGLMLLMCLALVLWPDRFLMLGNKLLRAVGRSEVHFAVDKRVAASIFLGYSSAWILYGVAFWLFVRAVAPGLGLVPAVGAFNAAYQVGYLALFAPGGFGARELVLGVLLVPFLGAIATAVAILARLWAILLETVAALFALAVRR